MISGSTSMPTETKKMAPKRFLTGSTRRMILSASTVSARMLPITKAPKALLKPTLVEMTAMRQQRPRATIRRVSAFMSLRTLRSSRGMRKMPMTNHRTRKKPILKTLPSNWPPSGEEPLAMAESMTIITMARMSSRMQTLMTVATNPCCSSPMSERAL